jgi:hypothetical protein
MQACLSSITLFNVQQGRAWIWNDSSIMVRHGSLARTEARMSSRDPLVVFCRTVN